MKKLSELLSINEYGALFERFDDECCNKELINDIKDWARDCIKELEKNCKKESYCPDQYIIDWIKENILEETE